MPLEKIVNKLAKGLTITKNTFKQISKVAYLPIHKVIKEVKPFSDYLTTPLQSQYKIKQIPSKNPNSGSNEQPVHHYDAFKFNETLIEPTPTGKIKQGKFYKTVMDEMKTKGIILTYINNEMDMF